MPTYNCAPYIGEAIASVLRQTWETWELIIIDDGSTDDTSTVLAQNTDPRIRVYRQAHRGVSAARNKGLSEARGDFITFLDADDVLPQGSLRDRAEFLSSHPEIDIVDGRIEARDETLTEVRREYVPYYKGPLLQRLLALDDRVFFGPFYMYRQVAGSRSRFPEHMSHSEDLLFFMRLAAEHTLSYAPLDKAVYLYRQRPHSAMTNLTALEGGYLELIGAAAIEIPCSASQLMRLKLRIARILLLSWLRKKKPLRAIRAYLSALVA